MREHPDALNILIVEDNPADLYLITAMLKETSLQLGEISSATSLQDAERVLRTTLPDMIILDLSLPDSFGLQSLVGIRKLTEVPAIILTGLNDTAIALEAIKSGAQDYIVKGDFNKNDLQKSISYSMERKRQEEMLRESEEKYRQIFQHCPYPCWIYDPSSLKLLEVNDAATDKYGYSTTEFNQLTLKDIQVPGELTEFLQLYGKDEFQGTIWHHRKKNGEMMSVETAIYPVVYLGNKAVQVQIKDITETKKLEAKLASEQRERQREITKAMLVAGERERKYVGEELHDNINQMLTTVKLYLDLCISGHDQKEELIEKSSRGVQKAIQEIRVLSKKLISPDQKTGSLSSLLTDLAQEISFASNIHFKLDLGDFTEERITNDLDITIYRIIQEQVNNILKHAQATEVTIKLSMAEKNIHIFTADNGQGFQMGSARRGIGLTNMISRVEMFNGHMEIDSSPHEGCRIMITLPLT